MNITGWPSFLEFAARQLDISTLWPSLSTINFPPKAENQATFSITSSRDWTIECPQDWLTANPETGENFSQVTITAKENTGSSERRGEVSFTVPGLAPKIIVVMQKSAPAN
jgi:hypothetical protein